MALVQTQSVACFHKFPLEYSKAYSLSMSMAAFLLQQLVATDHMACKGKKLPCHFYRKSFSIFTFHI